MTIAAGTKLGRYEIRSKIGEGGMGEVYLAEDAQLRRRVALKILPGDLASNQDRMRRFTQEAQAAAALNHPNIAHIYEIGSSPTVREGSGTSSTAGAELTSSPWNSLMALRCVNSFMSSTLISRSFCVTCNTL